mmetsp:Transcript_31423/g.78891  ORF Transcript_31423/g.78891 Transcript_31423/m.78891 type:complete len:279 (+) Transcript_31423:575-1411(+)
MLMMSRSPIFFANTASARCSFSPAAVCCALHDSSLPACAKSRLFSSASNSFPSNSRSCTAITLALVRPMSWFFSSRLRTTASSSASRSLRAVTASFKALSFSTIVSVSSIIACSRPPSRSTAFRRSTSAAASSRQLWAMAARFSASASSAASILLARASSSSLRAARLSSACRCVSFASSSCAVAAYVTSSQCDNVFSASSRLALASAVSSSASLSATRASISPVLAPSPCCTCCISSTSNAAASDVASSNARLSRDTSALAAAVARNISADLASRSV